MGLRAYQFAVWAYAGLYLLALTVLTAGTWGLLEHSGAPLAAVALAPLGLPWTLLAEGLEPAEARWVTMTAPLANLLLVAAIRRAVSEQ